MNAGLANYNAVACERALHPVCRCTCRGMYHGKAHGREWGANREAAELPALPKGGVQLDLLAAHGSHEEGSEREASRG